MLCTAHVQSASISSYIIIYKKFNATTHRTLSTSGYKAVSWNNHIKQDQNSTMFLKQLQQFHLFEQQATEITEFMKQIPVVQVN